MSIRRKSYFTKDYTFYPQQEGWRFLQRSASPFLERPLLSEVKKELYVKCGMRKRRKIFNELGFFGGLTSSNNKIFRTIETPSLLHLSFARFFSCALKRSNQHSNTQEPRLCSPLCGEVVYAKERTILKRNLSGNLFYSQG